MADWVGNISERGARIRKKIGAWTGILTVGLMIGFFWMEESPGIRFLMSLPIIVACISFLQAESKVCLYHAAKGTLETEALKEAQCPLMSHQRMAKAVSRRILIISIGAGVISGVILACLPI